MNLYIDIEDSLGNKLGNGPITSASRWRSTLRMDKAGSFEFAMPSSDPSAAVVQRKRIARAYALVGGAWQEVGAGIIDRIDRKPERNGNVMLRVSGDDLVRELSYRSVLNLRLYDNGLPVTHAAAVGAIVGYAPAGWTFIPDPTPGSTVYGYFNGETVLAGAIKVAEKSKSHFYRGTGRTLIFGSAFSDSGVRAIEAHGDLQLETCAIVAITEQVDVYDLLTRIYPRGSGNADVQLTLRATSRTAPAGYVLNAAQNYIEHSAAAAQYGRIERQLDYREIGPVANTAADIQSAANALFDAALEELRRAVALDQSTYTLSLAGCAAMLRPMQTIRVAYRDTLSGLSVDADLNILEATLDVDDNGVQTTGLVVSTSDRWAQSDTGAIIGSITEGRTYQALPQLNANSYVTAYTKNVDAQNIAAFRFRFGKEVTQLQQVSFEFQLLPFESTVQSVGAESSTTSSGGGSVQSAAAGGSHSHTVTVPAHSHTVTIPAHSHTITIPAHSHTITIPAHSHTITIPAHSHSVTIPAHTHDVALLGDPSPTGNFPYARLLYYDSPSSQFIFQAGSSAAYAKTTQNSSTVINSSSASSQVVSSSSSSTTVNNSSSDAAQQVNSSSTLAQQTPSSSTQSSSLQSSSTDGTHTHSVTIPSHTHSLTPIIRTIYGIYRDDAGSVLAIINLEYRVNSGSWLPLSGAQALAGGWWQLDLTATLVDATTLRPLQDDNLLEVRGGMTTQTINTWDANSGTGKINIILTTTPSAAYQVGDVIVLDVSGTDVDGLWRIETINAGSQLIIAVPYGWAPVIWPTGNGGTISGPVNRRATIDAQLAVRNVIQAIAYV